MNKNIAILLTVVVLFFSASATFAGEGTVAKGTLEGAFSSWGKSSLKGDWEIVEQDGKNFIVLAENFSAKEGPDVKIFLSPLEINAINSNNASEGAVFVKLISDFKGSGRYEIPAGTDVSQFNTLVFHCEQYSKLWGVSPL